MDETTVMNTEILSSVPIITEKTNKRPMGHIAHLRNNRMFIALLFAVSFTVYGVAGKSSLKGANIPCHFGTYDLNSDGEISFKEFLIATRGFTKMDPTTLFVRLDTNDDQTISMDEFTHVDPSLGDAGIIPRCRRGWCVSIKIGCITITISSDRQRPTQAESEKVSSEN